LQIIKLVIIVHVSKVSRLLPVLKLLLTSKFYMQYR